ncbi:MAG: hypothetical protein LGL72_03020 [Acidibrevibacterium sp.]|uniref:hypothetical protein n=1 Tax=Acidibrevibacterium fodinaquatile TaxID=1969806 RepID=UPI0013B3B243|nr:hypothetical protein [Acidibrevibacterium fodinaquatile]MCA7118382.1 hypothetical protein [Acidibrevibacterium fodinaquatile]
MLQITSGKLYPNGAGRKNKLRGVLYSNLVLAGLDDTPIVTAAGTLLQVDPFGVPRPLVYELTEQMEDGEIAAGVLVSHGVQPYLHDFAAVVSFVLRATCTPDPDLCARLLSGKRSLGVSTSPDKLLRRVFDKEIWVRSNDAEVLIAFVANLIALKRKCFLAAMQAIRTYVTGLHRIADDLELAYTLLVASIESLAQDFDGHEGQWSDYEESKRRRIDAALADADPITAERVRGALVKIEHLALSRRFRDFALDHIPQHALRETGRVGAPGRLDLRDGLKEAYSLRSRYVHSLRDLPRLLDSDFSYTETIQSGHATYLTLEGLSRVARTVILEFVSRQPKVETEVYDFRLERHGVMQAPLAPQYWIGRPELLSPDAGRQWLEGFLQQFAAHLLSKTTMTDLGAISTRIEEMLPGLTAGQRTPLSALYCIYNKIVPPENRSPNFTETINRNHDVLAAPSVEALVVHLILEKVPSWTLDDHKTLLDRYFNQRNQKTGFRAPELFEAGLVLALAERYRAAGAPEEAKSLLSFAADNAQNFRILHSIEREFDPEIAIDWGVLIPDSTPKQTETNIDANPALHPEGRHDPPDPGAARVAARQQRPSAL